MISIIYIDFYEATNVYTGHWYEKDTLNRQLSVVNEILLKPHPTVENLLITPKIQ